MTTRRLPMPSLEVPIPTMIPTTNNSDNIVLWCPASETSKHAPTRCTNCRRLKGMLTLEQAETHAANCTG